MRRLRLVLTAAAAAAVLSVPAVASAQPAPAPRSVVQHVRHHGYDLAVPASWRVVDLREDPTACIEFSVATVYVGPAGSTQDCSARRIGGAPGVWIRSLAAATPPPHARVIEKGAAASVVAGVGGESHVVIRDAGVLVSAFGGQKAADVLKSATLTSDARHTSAPVRTAGAETAAAEAEAIVRVEVPGTFRGRGFDACTAPGGGVMSDWKRTTDFRSVGVYIGGISRACAQPNLTAKWVRARKAGGWHPLPIWVGKQAPCTGFSHRMSSNAGTARDQGVGAAKAAVNNAQSLAMAKGSVIYLDIEAYNSGNATCRRAVLSHISGWVNELHRQGYRSGVYSSAGSGIGDLSDTYNSTSYARPNHIWAAWWNGERNIDFKPYVPDGQWDNRQRVHQYRGGHNESHGGHTLNIDSNFMSVH
jgi:hypothetical protein